MGEFGDARPLTPGVLLALSSFTLALLVDGLQQPIREFRRGQGRFTVGRFLMRVWDSAVPIPPFRLRRFPG
jgi:hypothetical protein